MRSSTLSFRPPGQWMDWALRSRKRRRHGHRAGQTRRTAKTMAGFARRRRQEVHVSFRRLGTTSCRSGTTASGCRRAFRSRPPPASVFLSSAGWSIASWAARSRCTTTEGRSSSLSCRSARPESSDLARGYLAQLAWFLAGATVQPARRCLASQSLRSFRLSSSVVPPQMPDSWFVARANSRQLSRASQVAHTAFARMICSTAGPVLPTGKNKSGSVSRHAARPRQSSISHSMLRVQVRATQLPSWRELLRDDRGIGQASARWATCVACEIVHVPVH